MHHVTFMTLHLVAILTPRRPPNLVGIINAYFFYIIIILLFCIL